MVLEDNVKLAQMEGAIMVVEQPHYVMLYVSLESRQKVVPVRLARMGNIRQQQQE